MSQSQITYAIVEPTSSRDRVFAAGYPTREAAERAAETAGVIWYRGYRIAEQHSARCRCEDCARNPWERLQTALAA